ncbi:MAG TPA: MFS transporter, partial [Micromonosporaceae bacterium]
RPAAKTLLSELTPKHRQVMIFAMYRLAYNLGTTAAPLIGAGLLAISYQFLFWGEAVAALAYAAIAAIALPRHRVSAADEPASAATDQAAPSQATTDQAPSSQAATNQPDPESATSGRGGYLALLADRKFVLFLLASLINAVVYVQYLSTLPVAMNAAGLGATWFGTMVAINGFIVITCELLVTKVVQRIPMRPVVMVGFLLLGGGLACYALPFGVPVFVIGTLIWSLAEIVAGPTMFAYPAVAGPERLRGRYIGAASATFGIGAAIGPALGLWVWNVAGIGVWWWCGLACLIGIATAWVGMRPAPAVQTTAPTAPTAPTKPTEPTAPIAPTEPTAPAQQQEPAEPQQPVGSPEPVRPQEATTR